MSISDTNEFSRAIQKLKSQYIYRFHSRYKKSGPIWRERYRSLLIENESYLYACGHYIENNPVAAGMVKEAVDWEYSSRRYYVNGEKSLLVDGYGDEETPRLPERIDIEDESVFEDGMEIGSSFFRFQMKEMRKGK